MQHLNNHYEKFIKISYWRILGKSVEAFQFLLDKKETDKVNDIYAGL
jgi:hypothetical protein